MKVGGLPDLLTGFDGRMGNVSFDAMLAASLSWTFVVDQKVLLFFQDTWAHICAQID